MLEQQLDLNRPILDASMRQQRYYFRRAFQTTMILKRGDSISHFLTLNDQQNTLHFLVRKRKLIKLVLALLASLTLVLLLTETELYYSLGESNWSSLFVLHVITALTVCFAVTKVLSILFYRQILVAQNMRGRREGTLDWQIVVTFVLYLVHPMFVTRGIKFTSRASFPEIQFDRPLNDYLTIFQSLVLAFEILTYLLYDHTKREDTLRMRLRKDHIVNPKVFFLKYYLNKHPMRLIVTMITYGALHLSFLLKIAESPEPVRPESNLYLWANCLWLAFVTMLTIGYGDFHPVTYQGRITAITIGIFGYISFSLILTAISQMNNFSYVERGMVRTLNWSHLTRRNQVNAANVIVRFSRLFLHIKHGHEYLYPRDKAAFEAAVIMFKESRNEITQVRQSGESS